MKPRASRTAAVAPRRRWAWTVALLGALALLAASAVIGLRPVDVQAHAGKLEVPKLPPRVVSSALVDADSSDEPPPPVALGGAGGLDRWKLEAGMAKLKPILFSHCRGSENFRGTITLHLVIAAGGNVTQAQVTAPEPLLAPGRADKRSELGECLIKLVKRDGSFARFVPAPGLGPTVEWTYPLAWP